MTLFEQYRIDESTASNDHFERYESLEDELARDNIKARKIKIRARVVHAKHAPRVLASR